MSSSHVKQISFHMLKFKFTCEFWKMWFFFLQNWDSKVHFAWCYRPCFVSTCEIKLITHEHVSFTWKMSISNVEIYILVKINMWRGRFQCAIVCFHMLKCAYMYNKKSIMKMSSSTLYSYFSESHRSASSHVYFDTWTKKS